MVNNFQTARTPNRKTFKRLDRLRETGAICPNKINSRKVCHRRTPRNEEAVLNHVENNPSTSISLTDLKSTTTLSISCSKGAVF